MTDRELIGRIARSAGGKAGYKQLVRELGLGGGRERRLLLEQLARITVRGELVKLDRELWGVPRAAAGAGGSGSGGIGSGRCDNLAAGRLDLHRDGYGFVRPNRDQGSGIQEDIFIPPDEINGAMQGDQVLVDVAPPRNDGRRMGRIARVLTRRNATVVGTFRYSKAERAQGNLVIPFDERMTQPIVIPFGAEIPKGEESETPHRVLGNEARVTETYDDLDGLIVDVEITSWPTPTKPAVGRVTEVLGSPDDFGVDVEMMIRKHQLPRVFPENVLAEARSVARLDLEEVARRRDFRGLPIVTIDGETARDFDDAVLVRELKNGGYELQVHIADVAEYVREGSDLDLEARLRGTSVYFPDRAIPMLPQELSTDICSLRPEEDRLVLSCVMQLDAKGNIESYEIAEGVICSAARMTYTKVHMILTGDEEMRAQYPELTENFELMHRVAMLMNKRRSERGSIDFDLPEPVIQFDEQGQMRGVTKAERTWANRLIEEFMLAANECVATWLEDLGVPSLYRIHERPEPRRVVEFEEQAASFGYSLGLGALPVKKIQTRGDRREAERSGRKARTHEVAEEIAVTPRMYQKLAGRIEGKPEERILSFLMLRSLKQAKYSEANVGHFALAAPSYTHFTSPIRRYPDLIVHRITKALLRRDVSGKGEIATGRLDSPWTHVNEGLPGGIVLAHPSRKNKGAARVGHPSGDSLLKPVIAEDELAQIGDETSQTERRAAEAERELVEWKKVRYMQDRVGEEFAALVLNPAKFGLFVELTDLFVEGLVPIDSLRDDRYTWREHTHEIVGDRWGRVFRAGDRVQVILDKILAQERKLQFSIVEEGIPLTGAKPRKISAATKTRKGPKKKNKDGTPRVAPAKPKLKKPKHTKRKGKRR
ncbi:ribonuclease R family protein [Terracidiphilus sp.]|uniref:ribonuclease R family protein n=1 Tax=Terracidiphilus sp. TaxID=1964191 RepID=UPI003C247D68